MTHLSHIFISDVPPSTPPPLSQYFSAIHYDKVAFKTYIWDALATTWLNISSNTIDSLLDAYATYTNAISSTSNQTIQIDTNKYFVQQVESGTTFGAPPYGTLLFSTKTSTDFVGYMLNCFNTTEPSTFNDSVIMGSKIDYTTAGGDTVVDCVAIGNNINLNRIFNNINVNSITEDGKCVFIGGNINTFSNHIKVGHDISVSGTYAVVQGNSNSIVIVSFGPINPPTIDVKNIFIGSFNTISRDVNLELNNIIIGHHNDNYDNPTFIATIFPHNLFIGNDNRGQGMIIGDNNVNVIGTIIGNFNTSTSLSTQSTMIGNNNSTSSNNIILGDGISITGSLNNIISDRTSNFSIITGDFNFSNHRTNIEGNYNQSLGYNNSINLGGPSNNNNTIIAHNKTLLCDNSVLISTNTSVEIETLSNTIIITTSTIPTAPNANSFYITPSLTLVSGASLLYDTATGQIGLIPSTITKKTIQDRNLFTQFSEDFDKIQPEIYQYKSNLELGNYCGVIAEQVDNDCQSFKNAVVKDGDNEIVSFDYQKMIGMLIYEVQQLKNKVRTLEDRLTANNII